MGIGMGFGDVVQGKAFLAETNSWFPREKPRQTRRRWDPEVAGPGDGDCQPVEDMGRNRRQAGGLQRDLALGTQCLQQGPGRRHACS